VSTIVPAQVRVLIIAEHASLRFGGEAAIPFHLFRVLREIGVECWMIVHSRTRAELEEAFGHDAQRISYLQDTSLDRFGARMSGVLPGPIWNSTLGLTTRMSGQLRAVAAARRLIRRHWINVVHQPIPVSPKEFSLVRKLGVPVVFGPHNGGMTFAPGIKRREPWWVTTAVRLGRAVADSANVLFPGKREAAAVMVANERTRLALPRGLRGRIVELVENGVNLRLWDERAPRHRGQGEPARFVFIGRLVDWKAVDLLIEATDLARRDAPIEVIIIGDGPERPRLEDMTRNRGLESVVRFLGFQPQAKCAEELARADALVLPSLAECGGAVVLEAMAASRAVIATKWGGPVDYLSQGGGVLVEVPSREGFVRGFADAMVRLARDPALSREMGRRGRQRVVEEFDWRRKGERIVELYREVIACTGSKPVSG
jgi:glycosyltransferase involved in cell wall biosynthesis